MAELQWNAFLKQELNYTVNLKDKQVNILNLLFERHNVAAILPTGYGKSLIYTTYPKFWSKVSINIHEHIRANT